jgi:hypothetical protein
MVEFRQKCNVVMNNTNINGMNNNNNNTTNVPKVLRAADIS